MPYLMGNYGPDDYRFVVRPGQPILASRNSRRVEWNEIPYAVRCWVYRSVDANGRDVEAHPFQQAPDVKHGAYAIAKTGEIAP
jgi:hypothetical protein